MKENIDLYNDLGINENATFEEIEIAYQNLIKVNNRITEVKDKIKIAYDVLRNPEERKKYDTLKQKAREQEIQKTTQVKKQKKFSQVRIKQKRNNKPKVEEVKIEHDEVEKPKIIIRTLEQNSNVQAPKIINISNSSNEQSNKTTLKQGLDTTTKIFYLSLVALIGIGIWVIILNFPESNRKQEDNIAKGSENDFQDESIKEGVNENESTEINDSLKNEILEKLILWNEANEYRKPTILNELYADQLDNYYGELNVSKVYCVNSQAKYFFNHINSRQLLKSEVKIETLRDSVYRCYFDKEFITNDKAKTYKAILTFQNQEEGLKIIEETTEEDNKYHNLK